jgi:hypothetical protein
MPTVLFLYGYRFYFFMNEHEPRHIHISRGKNEARVVLIPEIQLSYNRGFKKNELRQIIDLIIENYETIIRAWNNTFGK